YDAMGEILQSGFRPNAVFGANDYMAAGAMKRLHEAGMRVPDEVIVIGYDNTDIGSGLVPSLTTVDNRFYALGRALAEGVLALIRDPARKVETVVHPILVERDSHRPG